MFSFIAPNIFRSTLTEKRMPRNTYYGFQVGANGHHPEFTVDLGDGNKQLVSLGAPLILAEPTECQPLIEPVRFTALQVETLYESSDPYVNFASQVHALGMTCCNELAIAPARKLAAIQHYFTPSDGEGGGSQDAVLLVPFAGRERCNISINGDAGTVAIQGASWSRAAMSTDYDDTGATPYDPLNNLPAILVSLYPDTAQGSGTLGLVVENENFDCLVLYMNDGSTFSATCEVEVR